MAQADSASIPQRYSIQEAAAQIVALINSRPLSPRPDEIEAIIARAGSANVVPASPLSPRIRELTALIFDGFERSGPLPPRGAEAAAVEAEIDRWQNELESLEDQIPSPPRSFGDLVAWAEIARCGADLRPDGTMGECEEGDIFQRPAARLVEAVLQHSEAADRALMSPANAMLYREWRGLIEDHVREFEFDPTKSASTGGRITAESEAEEARMAVSLEAVDALADKILAEPVRAWGDLLPRAEVAFWYQWAGTDPQGPHARGQMSCGPNSRGKAIDQAVGAVLAGIFSLAGIGLFASEVRS
jgi:hypothetical protein